MLYKSIVDLPKGIKNNLPIQAQKIYVKAYNLSLKNNPKQETKEQTAHRVAWAAVKQEYEKLDRGWHKKSN